MATEGSVIIRSETEQVILDDLDFKPPCTITVVNSRNAAAKGQRKSCGLEADWAALLNPHCPSDKVIEHLLCTPHHDWMLGRGKGICGPCGSVVALIDYLISMERLNP